MIIFAHPKPLEGFLTSLRMLFGVSRIISEYLRKGDGYGKVAKVYNINIVYFQLGVGTEHVYCGTTEFRGLLTGEVLKLPEHFPSML